MTSPETAAHTNGTAALPRVFLSYSSHDSPFASQLMDDLSERGIVVTNRGPFVTPGESLSSAIASRIAEADAVVVLVSNRSSESAWVSREISYALGYASARRLIRIIPLLATAGAQLPMFLTDLRYIDMSSPVDYLKGLEQLVAVLRMPREQSLEAVAAARNALLHGERAVLEVTRRAFLEKSLRKVAKLRQILVGISLVLLMSLPIIVFTVLGGQPDFVRTGGRVLSFVVGVVLGMATSAFSTLWLLKRSIRRSNVDR